MESRLYTRKILLPEEFFLCHISFNTDRLIKGFVDHLLLSTLSFVPKSETTAFLCLDFFG